MQMDWMPIFSKVLEAVLIAVLPPLAVAVLGLVVALARKAWMQAKDAFSPQITDLLEDAAKMAVRAAEQAGIAELIEDKKQYAIQIVELWLEARHVSVDIDLIDAAIEAAVLKEFNKPELKSATERYLDEG